MQGNRTSQGQRTTSPVRSSVPQQKPPVQAAAKPTAGKEASTSGTKSSRSNTTKPQGNKFLQGCLGCFGILVVLAIVAFFVFALIGDDESGLSNQTVNAPSQTNKATQTTGVDGQVRSAITTAIGAKTNTGVARIIDLQVNDHAGTQKDGDKIVITRLQANDNLSNNMIKGGMQLESIKVFKELFKVADVEEVAITWEFPMTDKYGNTSSSPVMKIKLNRATATKINWDSFDKKNFESVANSYWEHPSIRSN
ncbi:hypothetical protein [Paenibacillus sp. EPM92]|uniref:hypothetical protein n=1 Tax=Paenibacillus sp. EPM92 TaxID=1561195 RepID=UPI001915155D|nr:hypothetical protein [Paenibacillus sp. EPM92]